MISKADVSGLTAEQKRKRKILDAAKDTRPITERLFSLHCEMLAKGWQDIMHAPKDGTEIEVVEMGSTGIHKAIWHSLEHDSLNNCGCFFVDGDWPSRPTYWRPIK